MSEQLCHCGKPLHYSDPTLQKQVEEIIAMTDEFIVIQVGDKRFKVQRHYIALHGIKGADIEKLGFEQVV